MTAEAADKDPEEADQAVESVRENPEAFPIQKAIGLAVSLQRLGKSDEAIEKWRAVAHVAEGSDNELAARAWFSVGYLLKEEDPQSCMAYDESIRLNPAKTGAYLNRGNAKARLKLKDEARKDFETALGLERNANDANIVARAEQALRDLDDAEGS